MKQKTNHNKRWDGDDYRTLFLMTSQKKSTKEIARKLNRKANAILQAKSKIRIQMGISNCEDRKLDAPEPESKKPTKRSTAVEKAPRKAKTSFWGRLMGR